jgi:hypothetical protein
MGHDPADNAGTHSPPPAKTPMQSPTALAKVAIVVSLPLLACFGYYTVERLGDAGVALTIAAMLAGPLALLGGAGMLTLASRRPRPRALFAAAALAFIAPALFLMTVWW